MNTINFSRVDKAKFFRTLNKRVNNYFKENNVNRTGNWKLYSKAILMFATFLVPFILVLTVSMPQWVMALLMVVTGIGMAGVGMNVMHDANHESFSKRKWVNKLMGSSIHILAGNDYNWKVQHNVLHHTFTNVKDHDEDIDAVFSDDGEQIFCASLSPTISGNNQALSEFSQLNGESAKGQWKLKVADEQPGDDGLLEAWSMTICTAKAVLAVAENNLKNFQFYPNPTEGEFRVIFSAEEAGDVSISIYDLLGRKLINTIYKESSVNFDEVVNGENLRSGIYILKAKRGQKVSFGKIKIK